MSTPVAEDRLWAAIGELRALAAGMHPAILTTRGLFAAVEALGADWRSQRSTPPSSSSGHAYRLPLSSSWQKIRAERNASILAEPEFGPAGVNIAAHGVRIPPMELLSDM